MSLKPDSIPPIPGDTARIARAAFPHGSVPIFMRDEFGALYQDEGFADLFPVRGQPAEAPWRLALVTVLQFAEGLSDRQAADAVRGRIDWKYALSLSLADAGFDATVLSEFRSRVVAGSAELRLLDLMLGRFAERGWLKARGRQRTDSTHVLAKIRALNRVLCVAQTLVHVLAVLAEAAPQWLRAHAQPDWVDRYGSRVDEGRLPQGEEARQRYAEVVGADGWALLSALDQSETPAWLRTVPAVATLRRIWHQQYHPQAQGGHWRSNDDLAPASQVVNSPYDTEARYGKKRGATWVGYKVHLTETCEDDLPHLITHVATTPAGVNDDRMTGPIHQALRAKGLLPEQHLVDTGYVDAELLVHSRDGFDVDLVGPTRKDYKGQRQAQYGFAAAQFVIDWPQQTATCPEGKTSLSWSPAVDKWQNQVLKIKFSARDCGSCPSRPLCTSSTRHQRRTLTIRPQGQYQALQAARLREQTEEFRQTYAKRAGIEGTHSQAVRVMGMRRSRYVGLQKTHLQHVITAASINLVRAVAWQLGVPHAATRQSPFAVLMASAA
jgi:transposase